ncbi:MAG: hypothetical protein ACOYXC_00820 [Candidatus Rifleibacteriota bacterium]
MMIKRWLPLSLNDKGIAMFSAIFVMLIISILALQFHFTSRQAQSTAFRFQASEIARQLAEAAMDEAFLFIYNETGKPASTLFKKLKDRSGGIDCSSTSLDNLTGKGVPIDVNLTKAQAASIQNGEKFDIEAVARIIDFRDADSAGGQYYGKEGIGTLEIKVSVTPKPAFQKQIQGACNIYRHHDYKVASIVSKRDNSGQRSEYVQNYVLDYALFIKNGQEEFDSISGVSLNPLKQQLKIDQSGLSASKCGKVFLGNRDGNFVYLNLNTIRKDFIPAAVEKSKIVEADSDQTFALLPTFNSSVRAQVKKAVDDEGADLESYKMEGHKAFFNYKRYPITDEALTEGNLKDFRDTTLAGEAKFAKKSAVLEFKPGIYVEPVNMLPDILEGDIRQRFFHFGYFYVDLSSAYIKVTASKKVFGKKKKKSFTIPFPAQTVNDMKKEQYPCFNVDHFKDFPGFNSVIDLQYLKDNFANSYPQIICDIDDSFRYLKGSNDALPKPQFYYYRNPGSTSDSTSASIPYAHANLWARRKLSVALAEEFGILEPKNHRINLRGIIQINEPITIGADGSEVKVHGQGVLIAPGITIKAGIKKADANSLCVLLTRGYPINVETDQELETSLISIGKSNRNGHIKAKKQLKLKGALAVDLLRLDQWAEGVNHTITYDPALKPSEDQYQITISRWVSFQKMVEHED